MFYIFEIVRKKTDHGKKHADRVLHVFKSLI